MNSEISLSQSFERGKLLQHRWLHYSLESSFLPSSSNVTPHFRTKPLWVNTKQLQFTFFHAVTSTRTTYCENNFNYPFHPAVDKCLKGNSICVVSWCKSFVINFQQLRALKWTRNIVYWRWHKLTTICTCNQQLSARFVIR